MTIPMGLNLAYYSLAIMSLASAAFGLVCLAYNVTAQPEWPEKAKLRLIASQGIVVSGMFGALCVLLGHYK